MQSDKYPLLEGKHPAIVALLGSRFDLTFLERDEERIAESEAEYRAIRLVSARAMLHYGYRHWLSSMRRDYPVPWATPLLYERSIIPYATVFSNAGGKARAREMIPETGFEFPSPRFDRNFFEGVIDGGLCCIERRGMKRLHWKRLTYDQFSYVCKVVRGQLDLQPPKKRKKLPVLLTEQELERFFKAIDDCGTNRSHFSGIRTGKKKGTATSPITSSSPPPAAILVRLLLLRFSTCWRGPG